MPAISVILPVYNSEKFIGEAVQSILGQTFTDFELLVINDASTDGTAKILESFDDQRLRVVHNETNLKVVRSLNKGLELAQGEFIARMDADDVSLPTRFEKQLTYFREHPEVDICGTWVEVFGDINYTLWPYEHHDDIKAGLLFLNIITHPSVMFRKKAFSDQGLKYDESFINAEDYGLWVEAADKVTFANVREVLLRYRFHDTNVSVIKETNLDIIKEMNFKAYRLSFTKLGLNFSDRDLELHFSAAFKHLEKLSFTQLSEYLNWLKRIRSANDKSGYYNRASLRNVLIHMMIFITKQISAPLAYLGVAKAFMSMFSLRDYIEFSKTRSVQKKYFIATSKNQADE